jgi:putative addiction module component (TIGR02574 family)
MATQAEIDRGWAEEIERRIDDLDAGRIKPVPIEEAMAAVEQKLKQTRSPQDQGILPEA